MKRSLGTFSISQELTGDFARLSGDHNPLHVDPVSARRFQYGMTVVHGMNVLFCCLDRLFETYADPLELNSMKAVFYYPVFHGEVVELFCERQSCNVKLELRSRGRTAYQIVFNETTVPTKRRMPALPCPDVPVCNQLSMERAKSHRSTVDLIWNPVLFVETFINVDRILSDSDCVCLLALTNIVGMKCPGLNSVFVGFNVSFEHDDTILDKSLSYQVSKVDERFSLVAISVKNELCDGSIDAIFRPEAVKQQTFQTIRKFVCADEFKGQNALIVGGSRGIGEITAKLVAAGGGNPVITFYRKRTNQEWRNLVFVSTSIR